MSVEVGADDVVRIDPVEGFDAVVDVPGSKSLSNRALLLAALADGKSSIENVLLAEDTEAMIGALRELGVTVEVEGTRVVVHGQGGRFSPPPGTVVHARSSGTTARFLLPVLAVACEVPVVLDGSEQLRGRPLGELLEAARALGGVIEGGPSLPITVSAGPRQGHVVEVPADVTSQFVSALMIAGPLRGGITIRLRGNLVAEPFVHMTAHVMGEFGQSAEVGAEGVYASSGGYTPVATYLVEPDVSAAGYFFAAAAICGGRVEVRGIGRGTPQGDIEFLRVLTRMGASVLRGDDHVVVQGGSALRGVDEDMGGMPDQALTLAAIGAFAEGRTRVTGVGFIRGHESDRIAAATAELRRLGVKVQTRPEGWIVQPSQPKGGRVDTYDDHRMAMAFALIGLRVPGIEIAGASCVAKTFPGYWDALGGLRPA